jgi:hypothetical protein
MQSKSLPSKFKALRWEDLWKAIIQAAPVINVTITVGKLLWRLLKEH